MSTNEGRLNGVPNDEINKRLVLAEDILNSLAGSKKEIHTKQLFQQWAKDYFETVAKWEAQRVESNDSTSLITTEPEPSQKIDTSLAARALIAGIEKIHCYRQELLGDRCFKEMKVPERQTYLMLIGRFVEDFFTAPISSGLEPKTDS